MGKYDIFQFRHFTNSKKISQELQLPQFDVKGRFDSSGYSFFFKADNNFYFSGNWDLSLFTFNVWITIVTDNWEMNHPIIQFYNTENEQKFWLHYWPYRAQIHFGKYGSIFVDRETGLYNQHYVWHYLTVSYDRNEGIARLFWDGSLWHTASITLPIEETKMNTIGINYPWVITNDSNNPIWMDDMYIDFTYAQKENFTIPTSYRAKAVDKNMLLMNNLLITPTLVNE